MSEISNDFRAKLQAKDPKFYGEGGMFNYENILNPIRQSGGMIMYLIDMSLQNTTSEAE